MKTKFILSSVLLLSFQAHGAVHSSSIAKPQDVVIAVIDTGADIHHNDLKDFIWVNPGETGKDALGRNKETNGVDDDGNGFVDDVHGWSFVDNSGDVTDLNGHGTHISGIIKKEFKKRGGTSAHPARLMILKYFNPNAAPQENALNTVKAINYAVKMRARIINYSAGGEDSFSMELEAIKKAEENNILFIAAAGNNKTNTDLKKYYPADYGLSNIISVGASDLDGKLVAFSNYGGRSVDLVAPGSSIYSTLPDNRHGLMSGTSQATAFVTGAAAALMQKGRSPAGTEGILTDLLALSKFTPALKGKTRFQMAMIE